MDYRQNQKKMKTQPKIVTPKHIITLHVRLTEAEYAKLLSMASLMKLKGVAGCVRFLITNGTNAVLDSSALSKQIISLQESLAHVQFLINQNPKQ
jgi:hypothetical protein